MPRFRVLTLQAKHAVLLGTMIEDVECRAPA